MADIALTPASLNGTAGAEIAFVTPANVVDRFTVSNNGRTAVLIRNGTGAVDVEVETHHVRDGIVLPAKTITIPANASVILTDFAKDLYDDEEAASRSR